MQESRVSNASRNIIFGMFLKGYQILMPFLMRTAMMYYMGEEYLGLNSLFGSILWVLNIAELGVGSAMVYGMYKPIIDNNKNEICGLLKLYRRYYRIIGILIAVVGIFLTPAIPHFIKKDVPIGINIYVVYLLNLFCTVMTYWLFAYKNSLLVAHQRNDISRKVMLVTNTFQYGSQFVMVMVFKDYYLYLFVAIITQALSNIIIAHYANKLYPEYQPVGQLGKDKIRKINNRIKDLFTSKLGNVIVSSCDSIVISASLGLVINAVYNNYYYILTAVMGIVKVVLDSCLSGIGNSILVDTKDKIYKDFNKLSFIVFWIIGSCSACLLVMYQPFMSIWVRGKSSSMLGFTAVVCFVIYFFIDEMNQLLLTYKDAAGIWHEDRFRPLVTAIANLVLDLIFVQIWGIYGVLWATVLSKICIGIPWLIYNLSTVLFTRSMRNYILKIILYSTLTAIVCTITYIICSIINIDGIMGLISKTIISGLISNLLFFLFYFRTKEFIETKELIRRIIIK